MDTAAPVAAVPMDAEFIERNQVVERYLAGKLPLKGAQDFERFCREHPEQLEQIGLADRVHQGLRLMEAGGQPAPWEIPPKRWWEHVWVPAGAGVVAVACLITAAVLAGHVKDRDQHIGELTRRLAAMPIDPVETTNAVVITPDRDGPSTTSLVTVGSHAAQLADLHFAMGWSTFRDFKITIDRLDQGHVMDLPIVGRDSNGEVRLAFNTSALGPGRYQFTLEGLNWKGQPIPQAWATLTVAH